MIQRCGDVFSTPLDDTLLMMSVEKGLYYCLDPIAGRIWDLLEQPATRDSIVARLLAEYEVSAEQCRADVDTFLAALRARDLLRELD